jgi:hypothetical protein
MRASASLVLVVDASVLRSAGETEHPVSKACRDALENMLTICHRTVLTPALSEERKRHASRFSRKWLRAMTARRKVVRSDVVPSVAVDTDALSEPEREALDKDRCLLDAAVGTDRVIVTRDSGLQDILAKTRKGKRLLEDIRWLNPVDDGGQALATLGQG